MSKSGKKPKIFRKIGEKYPGVISALESLPADVIVPSRLVVSRQTGARLLERIEEPSGPTPAMKELFDDPVGR